MISGSGFSSVMCPMKENGLPSGINIDESDVDNEQLLQLTTMPE